MVSNQIRFAKIVVAILSTVTVFMIVQVSSARPAALNDTIRSEEQTVEVSQNSEFCQLVITIEGDGSVSYQLPSGKVELLSATTNAIQVDCGEVVQLTAVPDPLQRFVNWQGVPEELQYKHAIKVASPAEVIAVFAPREILRYETLSEPFTDRTGQLVTEVPIMKPVWRSLSASDAEDTMPPVIDVWYGDSQTFGHHGVPQRWINILGNVSDPDGDLSKLEYTLNGGSLSKLNVGGDGHRGDGLRLYRQGDFNIDIDVSTLTSETNAIEIIATDSLGQTTTYPVTLINETGNSWPLPYGINWSSATPIQDAVQIVDGKWSKSADGVRPVETGFDRILAIGEMSDWSDFELTVPVTVHGYSQEGFSSTQNRPAMGLVMRWKGHTSTPDLCDQPLCGYYPIGATAWYEFPDKTSEDGQFSIWSIASDKTYDTTSYSLTWDETYYWKVRSQSIEGTRGRYSMKIWPAAEDEPDDWLVTRDGRYNSYLEGSALLLTHHVDVTFGNVSIVPYDATEGPPEIAGVEVIPEPKGATIHWYTDEVTNGRIDYGETAAYGSFVSDGLGTAHSLYIPGLDPEKEYHFKITVVDSSNESVSTEDDIFVTQELIPLVSDDFNACALDPVWEFINPLADGSYELNGIQAAISVPSGTNHDIWPDGTPLNRAPRFMQSTTDFDSLKVKFDSGVDVQIGEQGVVIEEDEKNLLRVNYQYEKGQLKLAVVGFKNGGHEFTEKYDLSGAAAAEPLYLRVTRGDGQWLVAHSTDDDNWNELTSFSFPLSVTKAGVYAGNAGANPAFTGVADYFFDTSAPVEPEDGIPLHLPVDVVGNGSVTKDPTCGSPVTLTAVADPGWHFVEWQGASIDGRIDLEITTPFGAGDEVTAVFAPGDPEEYEVQWQTDGQGSIIFDPDRETYIRGEVVELTADPAEGWQFDGWSGDLSGTDPVKKILMDGDKNVTANFSAAELNLDITVIGPGQVQITPQGPYDYGQEVTLVATLNSNALASFVGWSGDLESTDNPLKITMTNDLALTATFVVYKQFMPVILRPNG